MTSRLLPPAEWSRLVGTELEAIWAMLPPTATVVVVEDTEGAIVACWSLFPCLHAEGIWIAPAHRKRGAAGGRLLRATFAEARAQGVTAVVTSATTPEVVTLLEKIRAKALPGTAYMVPLGEH
jgi:Acetyltransferase (GNAT) family